MGVNIIVYGDEKLFPGFFFPKTQFNAPYSLNSLEKIAEVLSKNVGVI